MKVIQIKDGYKIWKPHRMRYHLDKEAIEKFNVNSCSLLLNRTYLSMFIEWYLHNIGYYVTKPFCTNTTINLLNKRFKDVDIEEWGN